MPAQRKPPGQRRRRNADQQQWHQLPAEGRKEAAPELGGEPVDWLETTVEWWDAIWASPMATVWQAADLAGLRRLARLIDDFARDDLPATALQEIQKLEDRYGLNPKARQALGWQIATPEPEAPARRRSARRGGAARPRLRAVDASEA